LLQASRADLLPEAASTRERLDMAVRTARENLAESRAMIAALTPPMLHDTDLADALLRQTNALAAQAGLSASTHVMGDIRTLPTAVEVVLLRATQEALTNVRRHADAHEVQVLLSYTPATVLLEIRDDGRGFDPSVSRTGYGLTGMQARIKQIGGNFSVTSGPGTGTSIRVEVAT
jgi:signal transduction histidine kinase